MALEKTIWIAVLGVCCLPILTLSLDCYVCDKFEDECRDEFDTELYNLTDCGNAEGMRCLKIRYRNLDNDGR